MLEVEDRAGPDWTDHSMQHRSAIADVSDLSMLREGHGLGIDTPDAHRQECGDTSIATTIHRTRLNSTPEKVRHIHDYRNLPRSPENRYRKSPKAGLKIEIEAGLLTESIHVGHRARAGAALIAATPARSHRRGRACGTFGRHGKNRKLLCQFLALAFGAFGFLAAVDQRFKWMIAFLANVLEDGHGQLLTVLQTLSI
jgi:hypothetical protein